MRRLEPKEVHSPVGMYSHGFAVPPGELIVVAGQVALDRDGQLVGPGDIRAQLRQTLTNLEAVLKAAGGSLRDVVKFTTYLTRAEDIPEFMEARRALYPGYFPDGVYPANTLLVVDRLVRPEFLIEIEAIAVKAPARARPARRGAAARPRRATPRARRGRTGRRR